jgi:hypothetical protein
MRPDLQDNSETPSFDLIKNLERLATEAGLTIIANFLRMAMMTMKEMDMSEPYTIGHGAGFDRDREAASAARIIERKIAEAVMIDHPPSIEAVATSLADLVSDINRRLIALNDKMEAGFKMVGTSLIKLEARCDDIETRLSKIDKTLYMPPDLVEALKNGDNP